MNTPLNLRSRMLRIRAVCVFAVAFVLTALVYNGCTNTANDLNGPFAGSGQTETSTLYGKITDEAGLPLPGVTVSAGTMSATTDANGLFIIKNAVVPKGRAVIIAKKAGYFDGARAEAPGKKGATRMELSMMTNSTTYTVSATIGGKVLIANSNGASIDFAAGSFLNGDGTPYTGSVKVAARYLDPKSQTFYNYFAGDEVAQTTDGKQVPLTSNGVLRVELTSAAGQALKLDASKPATLTYPSINDPNAPATMPLWYFDQTLGLWKEDGSAKLEGGKYVGTVTHFTEWNLDYKGETASMTLRVTCDGAAIAGVEIRIEGFNGKRGTTDDEGMITYVRAPADKDIVIHIDAVDNAGKYFINAPVTVRLQPGMPNDIGDIVLNSPCPASVIGSLMDCGDSKAEGLITITAGTNISYIYTKTGDFAFAVPSMTLLTLDAMDVSGNRATSMTITPLAESEQKNVGVIKVCGPNTSSFVDITIPGMTASDSGSSVSFSPDGTRIGFIDNNGNAVVYETETGNKLLEFAFSNGRGYSSSVQFSMDNKRLFVVSPYESSAVFDISSGAEVKLATFSKLVKGFLTDDGKTVLGFSYADAATYSADDGSLIKQLHPTTFNGYTSGGYIQSENSFVYYTEVLNGSYIVWDIATDKELRNIPSSQSYGAGISGDGERLSMTSNGKVFSIYDLLTGLKLTDINATTLLQGVNYSNSAINKNSLYISGNVGGAAVINSYSTNDGSLTGTKLNSGSSHYGVLSVSRNDKYLAAVGKGSIRLWKL